MHRLAEPPDAGIGQRLGSALQRLSVSRDLSADLAPVGTPELDMLSADGIAAVQSTPLISSCGRFWGVVSTHFRKKQMESVFDHRPLDRLAVQIADCLERRERSGPDQYDASGPDGGN